MNAGGVDDWRHYISAGGQTVAIVSRRSGVTTTRYLLNDHLGSIAAITDSSGAPIVTESFDAFGARRDGEDWDSDCNCSTLAQIASITRHGFTGHEMIGGHSMGLIHMNGRVMDSVTGRFLSPDPFVQFPFDSQSFNRYSYVRNNPLSFTDPSGFQEYDGDVIEPPEWEPPICWSLGRCGSGPIWFPRNYVIVRPPEPKIPPSRATPEAQPGPAVPAEKPQDGKKPWDELAWYEKYMYTSRGAWRQEYERLSEEQIGERVAQVSHDIQSSSMSRENSLGPSSRVAGAARAAGTGIREAVAPAARAAGTSIREAVAQINKAGVSQAEAIKTIESVVKASGREVGAVVKLADGSVAMTGKFAGTGQPVVMISEKGVATFGSATVRGGVDASGNIGLTVTDFVPKQ